MGLLGRSALILVSMVHEWLGVQGLGQVLSMQSYGNYTIVSTTWRYG